MPRRAKSKKLKQLEQKLKIIKKELEKRKKTQNVTSIANNNHNSNNNGNNISSSKKRGRKTSNKTPFEECKLILERIKKTSYAKPFLEPVDWKGMNIPNYPKIIKYPMDLSTIEEKMNHNQYSTPYDFAKDMRLIYQNACTFNKPGSSFYGAASKFAKKFEDEFDKKILDLHENNDFTKRIAKVVSILIKRDDAAAFRMPVDPKVLEIPDYFDVVENPMDLGTILNDIHTYTKFKEFVADLFLVWDNCCRYNPKQNAIHQQALKLRDVTTKHLNRLCQSDFQSWQEDGDRAPTTPYPPSSLTMNAAGNIDQHHQDQNNHNHINDNNNQSIQNNATYQQHQQTTLAPGPSGANLQSDSDHHTVNSQNNQVEYNENNQDVEMANNDNNINNNTNDNNNNDNNTNQEEIDIFKLCDKLAEEDEEEANKKMIEYLMQKQELNHLDVESLNFTQKEELQRGIQCLDSDHFDPLIQMLQSFIPEGEGDDDEVELDVDAIDDPLQVKMYNYMLKAIHQQETERIQREGGDISMLQQPQSLTQTQSEPLSINAMEIDHHQQTEETNVAHMSGKGGFSNINDTNNDNNNENDNINNNNNQIQQNQDNQMNAMETDNHQQTEETQSTFPTTFPTSHDANSSIPGNADEAPQEDSAANFTFAPTLDSNQETQNDDNLNNMNIDNNEQEITMNVNSNNDKEEEEEDQDIDMENNQEANDNDEDILADIANAVDENETTSTPVPDASNTDQTQIQTEAMQTEQLQNEGIENKSNGNGDNQSDDNDVTDTELNDNDNNATPPQPQPESHSQVQIEPEPESESQPQPQTIPTMPELQPDSDNNASKDPPSQEMGQEMEQQKEEEENNMNAECKESAEENIKQQIPSMDNINNDKNDSLNNYDPNLNVNDALSNDGLSNNDEQESIEREDEEVDTPLADDIEF